MFFMAQSIVSSADTKLYLESFTISIDETKTVSLILDNDQAATVLQAEIALPNGLEYVAGTVAITSRVKGGATAQASIETGKLVIVETGGKIAAGEGAVVTFDVKAGNTLEEGKQKITLTEIVVSDANGDPLYYKEKDEEATVTCLGLSDCTFAGPESIELTKGEEYQIDITLANEGVANLSALSGTLTLPEGLELVEDEEGELFTKSDDRAPSPLAFTTKQVDGYTNFVLSSLGNTCITGIEGVIFSFKVKATATVAKDAQIVLSNLRVAATNGKSALSDDVIIAVIMEAEPEVAVPGDVDGDGKVTLDDLNQFLLANKDKSSLPTEGDLFIAYDANGDGKITIADAQAIFNLASGKNADGTKKQ